MELILITTPTCIKCKSLKPKLEEYCSENNIPLRVLNAFDDGASLVDKYKIQSVPVVIRHEDSEDKLYTGDFIVECIKADMRK